MSTPRSVRHGSNERQERKRRRGELALTRDGHVFAPLEEAHGAQHRNGHDEHALRESVARVDRDHLGRDSKRGDEGRDEERVHTRPEKVLEDDRVPTERRVETPHPEHFVEDDEHGRQYEERSRDESNDRARIERLCKESHRQRVSPGARILCRVTTKPRAVRRTGTAMKEMPRAASSSA